MASYDDLVGTGTAPQGIIRDWANRDYHVLPQSVVMRCLDWAADICYKKLQIPPLEETLTFSVTANDITNQRDGTQVLEMPIPEDLIEPIFIRRPADGTVFSSRIDRRTIYDIDEDRLFDSFTQIGNNYHILGRFTAGEQIELHYYRRLPGLNATYSVVAVNWVDGDPIGEQLYLRAATSAEIAVDDTQTLRIDSNNNVVTSGGTVTQLRGNEVAHWLRDENERVLVYGTLVEIFNFLDEPEAQARYKGMFEEEIARLNEEQNRRFSMGGNIQVSYSGRGLL